MDNTLHTNNGIPKTTTCLFVHCLRITQYYLLSAGHMIYITCVLYACDHYKCLECQIWTNTDFSIICQNLAFLYFAWYFYNTQANHIWNENIYVKTECRLNFTSAK